MSETRWLVTDKSTYSSWFKVFMTKEAAELYAKGRNYVIYEVPASAVDDSEYMVKS